MIIDNKEFDFIDFGASKGGCIEFAKARLNGKNGLGIDISPKKVEQMLNLGFDCIKGDITKLENIDDKSVDFVTISHVLEHLLNIEDIERALCEAARVAKNFIFIQGPFFDADKYLESRNLKFYWSDWRGHTYHLSVSKLNEILASIPSVKNYETYVRVPVIDSSDSAIHPVVSPSNQHDYDKLLHPIKEEITFDIPIYREFVTYVRLNDTIDWKKVTQARKGTVPYMPVNMRDFCSS